MLHGVTFNDVADYSGILPDLAGFTTDRDSVRVIPEKITAVVLAPEAAYLPGGRLSWQSAWHSASCHQMDCLVVAGLVC